MWNKGCWKKKGKKVVSHEKLDVPNDEHHKVLPQAILTNLIAGWWQGWWYLFVLFCGCFFCLALLVCFLYIHFWLLLLNLILGDVNGSLEAINDALQTYKSRKISLNILSAEVGAVNENDIKLAETFKGRRSYFLTVAYKSWNNFSLFSLLPSAIFRYSVWF